MAWPRLTWSGTIAEEAIVSKPCLEADSSSENAPSRGLRNRSIPVNTSRPMDKIVVAYSGGLDTSVLLNWLKETYGAEIVASCAGVGQGDELDSLE